jgi:hypothetical protein
LHHLFLRLMFVSGVIALIVICPFSRKSRWNCSLNATFIKSFEQGTIWIRSHSFRLDSWHPFLHFLWSLKYHQFLQGLLVTTKSDYVVFDPSTQRHCFLNTKKSLLFVQSSLKMNCDSNKRFYFVWELWICSHILVIRLATVIFTRFSTAPLIIRQTNL